MRLIKTAVLLFVIILLPYQTSASENIRKITVTGKSEIVVEAHYAIIQISIKEVKMEMNQSHAALMKTISELTDELKNVGLSGTDIKKSLILQGQESSWERNSKVLRGYYSQCLIDLYVKNIGKISDVYKTLADHQDITIHGTDFRRNDEFDIRKTEYEKAIKTAKSKAEYMAKALSAQLGKVYSIQELSSENYFNAGALSNIRETGTSEDTTGYGNIKISAVVVVEFELK